MPYFQCNTNNFCISVFKIADWDDARLKIRVFRKKEYTVSLSFISFQGGLVSVDSSGDNLPIICTFLSPNKD